jgi:hypothetical protein
MGALVQCTHQGPATPPTTFPRVLVSGMPVAMQPIPWVIAGCANPPASGGPCVTAMFPVGSTRVFVNVAVPVLLLTSIGNAAPTGLPVMAKTAQVRVMAT